MAALDLNDIVIVGGGLGGSMAAALLGRAGYRVTVIDLHETYPADFRAEQVVGSQVVALQRLGLFGRIGTLGARIGSVVNTRRGRVVDVTPSEQYGLPYQAIVAEMRAQVPAGVVRVTGKVSGIETSDDVQRVHASDGRAFEGRLVVMATGLNAAVARGLGIGRRVVREGHSISIGFDIALQTPPSFEAMTCYGERLGDGVDYLALFRSPGAMRANLFVYWPVKDARLQRFKVEPEAALKEALPSLAKTIGTFSVTGPVQARPVDLYAAEGFLRAGVVLVGDAFQTSCPAAGTGMDRVLSDVEQLCAVHVPRWLATSGMGAAKIASFYADPVKTASDRVAWHVAEYRRSVTIETSLGWRLHRLQAFARRRLMHRLSGMPGMARRRQLAVPARMGGIAIQE